MTPDTARDVSCHDAPPSLAEQRRAIRDNILVDEAATIKQLVQLAALKPKDRTEISTRAAELISAIRDNSSPTIMEGFLSEYGLSSDEGVALMCLAEALLRVPDTYSMDALIKDKIAPGKWSRHLGQASSSLVNASTWALMLTGKVLTSEELGTPEQLSALIQRLGMPVIRNAVNRAMQEMGRQFVFGRNIDEAHRRALPLQERGYTFSYDMLGEAARTDADAVRYFHAYDQAIEKLSRQCTQTYVHDNPGISVKLSALSPRYEFAQRQRVLDELVPRTLTLAKRARAANMGFNIDAEEADRLDLSLDIIEAVLADPELAGWDGFGIAVQAYGPRAHLVIDWLYTLACRLDRRIAVRLVKGAYWDTEIKRAQVMGLAGFPVFTRKHTSDLSYMACARKLLSLRDRIYSQFATHNAHTAAAVHHMADDTESFEFQRLHGMGEALFAIIRKQWGNRCRIYAPIGAHRDLLSYLVRRLLENGANSSFVHQIVNAEIPPQEIAADPLKRLLDRKTPAANPGIATPPEIYGKYRRNARGWDLTDPVEVEALEAARLPFANYQWRASSNGATPTKHDQEVRNPARPDDVVGWVSPASAKQVSAAIEAARETFPTWSQTPVAERAQCLRRVADLYEEHHGELFALLAREAGKTLPDAIAEVREAVDFARYYAQQAKAAPEAQARGPFACISPWNFPLAIFSGQVLAALVSGNTVLAKPAEQTPLVAARAIALMHQAGIPKSALHCLPGDGPTVGAALTSNPAIAGVCFTGSTETAHLINRAMAKALSPEAPLIAETGGLNAMIVDSTALPEQAVRDILASSFQSAGQRCSALRVLYVQKDVAEDFLHMLTGAMETLEVGDPWLLSTDVGPVIDTEARQDILSHISTFDGQGKLIKRLKAPKSGYFVPPALIRVRDIDEISREIFGPVLHVATFAERDMDRVIDQVNGRGYGLTFGLHTRVDARVQRVSERIRVGNTYVNRNQVGAVVGSQPFGGEGLSGTGPKAGGPHYLSRFRLGKPATTGRIEASPPQAPDGSDLGTANLDTLQRCVETLNGRKKPSRSPAALLAEKLPQSQDILNEIAQELCWEKAMAGPTGELNKLTLHPRGTLLCTATTAEVALDTCVAALACGNRVVACCPEAPAVLEDLAKAGLPVAVIKARLDPASLRDLSGFHGIIASADKDQLWAFRSALAERKGALLPLISAPPQPHELVLERHLCVDTTAAGGNTTLFTEAES